MKQNQFLTIAVAVAFVVAVIGVFTPMGQSVVREIGGAAGPEVFDTQNFRSNFTVGGKNTHVATSSTAATFTLTTRTVRTDVPFVSWTPNVDTTLTTMASTSAPFNNLSVGESFEQIWYNASTTAAATITFAAGTGVDLQEDEGGTVIVNGLETARVTFIKKVDTDIAVIVEPYQVGD